MTSAHSDDGGRIVQSAATLLRDTAPPGELWRQGVLREIAATSTVRGGAGRWSVRPVSAIAACLACALIGGVIGTVAERRAVASASASIDAIAPGSGARSVRFELVAPDARYVAIVGDFNRWNPNALQLQRASDGTWAIEISLVPGRYAYSFMVNGRLVADPRAPRAAGEDFGKPSSIRLVAGL